MNLPSIDLKSYKPLREQIYEVLREAIIKGDLKPGMQVTEVEIADKLNVSRTPVRESIRMLELEGLMATVPRRGSFVAGIRSNEEINNIYQVRIVLEGLAASLAAKNISSEQIKEMKKQSEKIAESIKKEDLKGCMDYDAAFHQTIYEASQNKFLQKILDNLLEEITRFRVTYPDMSDGLTEHQEIIAALEKHDLELAQELASKHIEKACQRLLEVFEEEAVAD